MLENSNTMIVQLNVGDLRRIISEEISSVIENSIPRREDEQATENNDEIMGVKDVCRLLKIEAATLYKKTSERSIPFYKAGGKLTFSRKEIRQWLLSGKVLTRAERNELSHEILIHKNKNKLSR